MIESFFLILKNTFLAFFLIPLSSGTYYKVGLMFYGNFMPYTAKIFGIFFALVVNYFIGFLMVKIFKKKLPQISNYAYILLAFSFIPVISGIIACYFGMLKANFNRFLFISMFVNAIYHLLGLYFPVLNFTF